MDAVQYYHFSRAPPICTTNIIIGDMECITEFYWYHKIALHQLLNAFVIDVRDEKIKAELLAYEKSKPSFSQPPRDESSNSDEDDDGKDCVLVSAA